ncbi:MAG: hypothetical protein IH582_20410 [Afipia sp.]|nr:hypothetical protein [Afipia sp.]
MNQGTRKGRPIRGECALIGSNDDGCPGPSDDIDALKVLVAAMADRNAAVEAENTRIRAENAELAALNRNADERIARLMFDHRHVRTSPLWPRRSCASIR